tara:strand:+ start:3512 stop:3829 length:318 start_codon:yes stop_codon:yes gene_type:complete
MIKLKLYSILGSLIILVDYIYSFYAMGNPKYHYDNTDPETGISTYPLKYDQILRPLVLIITISAVLLTIYHLIKIKKEYGIARIFYSFLPILMTIFCYGLLYKIL